MKFSNAMYVILLFVVLIIIGMYVKLEAETYFNGCRSDLDCAEGLFCKNNQCSK